MPIREWGEQNKRIPKEFKEIAEIEPLIANKQFYYRADLDVKKILSNTLINSLMKFYVVGKPINQFLVNGING